MRKLFPAFLLAALFLLWLAVILSRPTFAQEPAIPPAQGPPPPGGTSLAQLDRAVFAKIEPQLLKQLLTQNTPAPFIVHLKAGADLAAAVAAAPRLMAQGLPDKIARRTAVMNALQQTAQNSQGNVLQLLNRSAAPGGLSGQSMATTKVRSLWIVNAVAARGSLETVLALAALPEVEVIRLDRQIQLEVSSAREPHRDPGFSFLGPRPIANRQAPVWSITKIRADLVHTALQIDGSGVVVASIDTGVDWQHPALQASYRGYTGPGKLAQHLGNWHDATDLEATYPVDSYWHGTHTMGSMVGSNGVGVAPGARWITVRAFDSAGIAQGSWLHRAFEWILAPNGDPALAPDIVNNSWSNGNAAFTEFLPDVQALISAGIYPVFAAGNNGPQAGSIGSPGSYQGVLAVGATTIDDEVAGFSGRGPSPWGEVKPEISAPGKAVVSTMPGGIYEARDGTSMAAPHVAGLAALLLQASPSLEGNLTQLTRIITSTATSIEGTEPNNKYGWGRVDAYNAVMSVAGTGLLRGTVTRAGTGTVVPNATIRIAPRDGGPAVSTLSDAAGVYQQGLVANTYDVTASAFGYQPATIFNVNIEAGQTAVRDFNLLSAPVGTIQGVVKDKNSNAPLAATLYVDDTPVQAATNPNDGGYRLILPVGSYTIRVVAKEHRVARLANVIINDGATITENFLLDSAPSILVVDSGKWYQESQLTYYQQALDDALYPYDIWQITDPFGTPGDVPITSTLAAYDVVIWSAPEDSPGYVGADAALSGYLEQGGKLLVSGQNVAFFDGGGPLSASTNYLQNYLKTIYAQDNADSEQVVGVPGGVFPSLSLKIAGGTGANNQTTPDVVRVTDTGFAGALLAYETGGLAGVSVGVCVPYRAIVLAFGFEAIDDRAQRGQVMEQVINWLLEPPAADGLKVTPATETRVGNFGATVNHALQIWNTGTNSATYNLSLNSNWPVNLAPPASVTVESCQTRLINFEVVVNTTAWHQADTSTLTIQSNLNPAIRSEISRVTKSPAPVLLVDDDRFYSFATEFETALQAGHIAYDYWPVSKVVDNNPPASPPQEVLNMYPVTVWYTAYDWFQPLIPDEEERLIAYLERGGRIFFSSQDYLYHAAQRDSRTFSQKYLGILAYTGDYSSTIVTGQKGNLISTHLGPYRLIFPYGYVNNTDALQPIPTAQVVSTGEKGQINGLMNRGLGSGSEPWRTVFLAYGPELLTPAQRTKLLQRSVGWLGWLGSSTVTPSLTEALAGQTVLYTATLVNDGWENMNTATFTATFPTALTLQTYSPDLTPVEGSLVWRGPLAKNERKVFNYTATLADPLPLGSVVSQTNRLTYDNHNLSVDRVATVYVNFPNLEQSTLTVAPAYEVQPGDTLTYTITLKNTGLVDDPLITTTTTLPHMLELVAVDQPGQGDVTVKNKSLTWSTPLAVNEAATLTYRAVISYYSSTPIDNIAYVNDGLNEQLILKARAYFKGGIRYFPILAKDQ